MSKIFLVKGKYRGSKSRFYRTEEAFMEAVSKDGTSEVIIYEEVDRSTCGKLKTSIITQRERDEQLSSILENDPYISNLMQLKSKLIELCPDNRESKEIVSKFQDRGVNTKTMKNIASGYRNHLLYKVSNSQEWYEILLKCHRYTKIDLERSGGYQKPRIQTPKEAIENFNKAKESIKSNDKK